MRFLTLATIVTVTMGSTPHRMGTPKMKVERKKAVAGALSSSPLESMENDSVFTEYNGGITEFLRAIARLESNGKIGVISRFGYLGKYQFHPKTIRSMGFNVTNKEFLSNEKLQDRVMLRYMRDNEKELKDIIDRWVGKNHRGVDITHSGIIAAAHFAGTTRLRQWFRGKSVVDANGASIRLYMTKFANYDIKG